jgi:T-complex protein 1 subunit delta
MVRGRWCKVVSQYSTLLAPLAVDAVLSVVDPAKPDLVESINETP